MVKTLEWTDEGADSSGQKSTTLRSGGSLRGPLKMDEAFYILDGSGTFILNDVRHPIEKGGTIFIPKNAWHGFENPGQELLLLWIVAPAGLEAFFRETCLPPGMPKKSLTKEQVNQIAAKYDTEFR